MEFAIAPRGLIVDLITPLENDGAIDVQGLGRLIHRVSPHVQALFLASPHLGEGTELGLDQRVGLLRCALEALAQNPLPTLIWVTRKTEEETIETILALKKGIEMCPHSETVFFVDAPLYYHSNRGLPSLYRNLTALADGPFLLHNDPELIKGVAGPLKRNNIRTSILKELTAYQDLGGMIFLGTLDRAHNYQRACRNRTHFRIYDGDESRFLHHPSMSGVVSAGANLVPKAWQRITYSSLHLSADHKQYPDHLHQIWEVGKTLRNLMEIYHQAPVDVIKGVLSRLEIINTSRCIIRGEDRPDLIDLVLDLMGRSRAVGP